MAEQQFQIPQLANEIQPSKAGKQNIVLTDNDNTNVVLLTFSAGDALREHAALLPAIIQNTNGEAERVIGEQAVAGKWIQVFLKTLPSIEATTSLVMLLTLLKTGSEWIR